LIFLYRHSGEACPGLEPEAGIQVEKKNRFSGCRIKSGMTEIFEPLK
jgi:hypothetical protein